MRHPLRVLGLLGLLGCLGLGLALFLRGGGGPNAGAVVSVYTAHDQATVDAFTARFTEETGVRVQVVKLGSGEVIQRVVAEASAPQCDVIWSIAGDQLASHPEVLELFRPDDYATAVAAPYREAVGDAPWLPYTVIVPVFLVRNDEGPTATSWRDLAKAELRGQISSARADKSGSAFLQLTTLVRLLGEDEGWPVVDAFLENGVLSGSSSAVPRFVNDGEARVGVTLEDSAQKYVAGGGPVKVVYPSEGTCPAPDGVALVKGAPHGEAARTFVRWALSQKTQAALVERMGRRSVRVDVDPPKGLPALDAIGAKPHDFEWAAKNQARVLARWRKRVDALGK